MLGSRLRWFGLLMVLSVGLALVACSSDDPSRTQPQQQTAAQTEGQLEQEQPQAQQAVEPAAQQTQPEQQTQQSLDAVQEQESAAEPVQQEQPSQQQATEAAQQEAAEDEETATQQADADADADADAFAGVPGVVDPTNLGWPRAVEGLNGIVSIPAQPLRIITASIGHDELALALAPSERLVAVGAVSKDVAFSNVADLVVDKPEISRDPETIIAQSPDIVVTSPWFPAEAVDALERAGILVVQTALELGPEAQIANVLLMGYILGEEQRALDFAEEVRSRYQAVLDATGDKSSRPSVISLTQYGESLWTAGAGATEGSVIAAAGGINAAAEAGIEGNQTIGLEGVIAMAPEIIVIPQPPAFGAEEFRQSLFDNEALAEVPAIKAGAVHIVESKHFTTLSHWNIRGVEGLARLLWPDDFPEPAAERFSLPE